MAYKRANSIFKKAAKTAKRKSLEIFTSKISPSSTPKKIWSDIKRLTGVPPTPITAIQSNNTLLTSPEDIAATFANFWLNLSDDKSFSAEYISEKQHWLSTPYNPMNLSRSAQYVEDKITFCELEAALKHAKGKTPGIDRISYPMLSNLPLLAKHRLLSLYNSIFSKSTYPHIWRTATVIPIAKPSKPINLPSSFRPISLLSCLTKTFEKILAKRLMWFVTKNNLIKHNQTAFKNKHSTMDSLIQLQHFISDSLSTKNHASILATDFEKAFDRVGVHAVLSQLASWKIGPKAFQIVKAFMAHRKFRVRVNNVFSDTHQLKNGIPQGSPLSVVLFIIAFDKLTDICLNIKSVKLTLYADDAIVYTNLKDPQAVNETFHKVLSEFKKWGLKSGASISIPKCKLLHICKKVKCNFPQLVFDNTIIQSVSNLKILGIWFDNKFTFKHQCINLRKNLSKRLNIIKYISSKKSFIHSNTLINITKAIILSKIDYGLPIFGWCANTNIKQLEPIYHASIRRSINAFPTSPIKCILGEAGFPALRQRVYDTTIQLIPKVLHSPNYELHKTLIAASRHKRNFRLKSTLRRCVRYCQLLKINIPPNFNKTNTHPDWLISQSMIDTSLHTLKKSNTSNTTFQQRFLELVDTYKQRNFTPIYTDGSKATNTAFAATLSNGTIITGGILTPHSSVFTAETFAIYKALEYAIHQKGKYVICSDSLSCLNAVTNIRNSSNVIGKIRDLCIKHKQKIALLWVPGHVGIPGNEQADNAAKYFESAPTFQYEPQDQNDVKKMLQEHSRNKSIMEWRRFEHRYTNLNPARNKVIYPTSISRLQSTIFTRLRIGHTQLTHQHILIGRQPPNCPFCGNNLSIDHIFNNCLALESIRNNHFITDQYHKLLTTPSHDNITKIYNFLVECNLQNRI